MKIENFILNIIKKIESLKENVIAYAYKENNSNREYWIIAVSDYNLYINDKRFKTLMKAWHKAIAARKKNICFVYCNPLEGELSRLAEKDNLLMNI